MPAKFLCVGCHYCDSLTNEAVECSAAGKAVRPIKRKSPLQKRETSCLYRPENAPADAQIMGPKLPSLTGPELAELARYARDNGISTPEELQAFEIRLIQRRTQQLETVAA